MSGVTEMKFIPHEDLARGTLFFDSFCPNSFALFFSSSIAVKLSCGGTLFSPSAVSAPF